MAKFNGRVGYVASEETAPGVFSLVATERVVTGDILRSNHSWQAADQESTNQNLRLNNRISIIADPFVNENFDKIRYVVWLRSKWVVTSIEVQYPKVILTIGGPYNGN